MKSNTKQDGICVFVAWKKLRKISHEYQFNINCERDDIKKNYQILC